MPAMGVRTFRLLLLAAGVGVLVLSLVPVPLERAHTFGGWDKVLHVLAYAVLGFMAAAGFPGTRLSRVALVAAVCTLFGALMELLQGLVGRDSEWLDLAADLLGAAGGALLAHRFLAGRLSSPRR